MPNKEQLQFLEDLRKSGATNMFGAAPYLMDTFGIDRREANATLLYWMNHYEELSLKFGW